MGENSVRRTMTMSWDGLAGHSDDDSDDLFFDSTNRVSSVVPLDLLSSDDDDNDDDDSRLSFSSAVSSASALAFRQPSAVAAVAADPHHQPSMANYDVWMAAPGSIKERRKRLLQGMGLNSRKDLYRLATMRLMSGKFNQQDPPPPSSAATTITTPPTAGDHRSEATRPVPLENSSPPTSPSSSSPTGVLFRSRSDGDMESDSFHTKRRWDEIIGSNVSKQRLIRTSSTLAPFVRMCRLNANPMPTPRRNFGRGDGDGTEGGGEEYGPFVPASHNGNQLQAFFLIKNLDTGKEFIVREFDQHGMWNRLRDLQTGKQLTMEEFEQTVGHSPVVKELMRRQNAGHEGHGEGVDRKLSTLSKRFRHSKKRGVSLLKNLKSAAWFNAEKEISGIVQQQQKLLPLPAAPSMKSISPSSWIKVRQQGKTVKELTALRLCQEIQAHEGSIWTMKFNVDGKYLASAGEDKVIHVWEVQECEIATLRTLEDGVSANSIPLPCSSLDRNLVNDFSSGCSDKKKKWKLASKKGAMIPDYVQLPDTMFALSDKPFASFTGHLDDVLDLSWSRSQLQLLSSSMDKTVRLWDLETRACLRLFAHNDYVTCIQFNPVDDNYFISGSLDAKLRIWSVPERCVVDWHDHHEMITAACYSPDGQSALVGSHKGSCRTYSTTDGKLTQISQFDLPIKKKKKLAKITGFEFPPDNPSEALITSADSRIRIYDGLDMVRKFMGFRNTSSQIAASYSPCGKHIICASEDSNVYVWKQEEPQPSSERSSSKGKTYTSIRSYEQFQCKNVSVAIPWPGSSKFEPPTVPLRSKKASKRFSDSPTKAEPNTRKQHLPPLPRKTRNNHNNNVAAENAGLETGSEEKEKMGAVAAGGSPESEIARIESGATSSFGSSFSGGSMREGDSPLRLSTTSSLGWSWHNGGDTMQATAWGLVVVTAGLGGEIRAYQNFGLPVRIGRR